MRSADDASTNASTTRRVTVFEAAAELNISPDAVRSRLRRGTLRKDHGPEGEVLVILNTDASTDQSATHRDASHDASPTVGNDALVEALQRQLDEVNTANAELRRIIAALTQRIPEIESADTSPEATGASVRSSGPSGNGTGGDDPHEPPEPRSWWRRFLGVQQ